MHDHHHHHAPVDHGRAFAVGVALNLGFVVVEFGAGWWAGSLALISDAGHNLSDVLGLLLAWGAAVLARRQPTARRTYGLRRTSILAALLNAVLLLVAIGGIAWEAWHRLLHPQPVSGGVIIGVAAAGIVVNGATAMLFAAGRHHDLNIRGAFLHMVADAAISAGVLLAGLAILAGAGSWMDPAVSLVVVVVIAAGTWDLLRESLDLALDAVPPGIDSRAVEAYLSGLTGVIAVHDIHIWAMSTTEIALTAHLVCPLLDNTDDLLQVATHELDHNFGISHVTLQIERSHCLPHRDNPCGTPATLSQPGQTQT